MVKDGHSFETACDKKIHLVLVWYAFMLDKTWQFCGDWSNNDYFILQRGILERLDAGEIVIGDGGFLFALEKRGYVKFGVYTPECTVEQPEAGTS